MKSSKIKFLLYLFLTYNLILLSACTYSETEKINDKDYEHNSLSIQQSQENAEQSLSSQSLTLPTKKETPINIGETMPITRGIVAKMIALTFASTNEINSLERKIPFTDTQKELWYDRYINFVFSKNYMNGSNDNFSPEEYLSVSQAQTIIDKIDTTKKIKINSNDTTKNKPISYNLWTEIYMKVLKNLSGNLSLKEKFGIEAKKEVILATSDNNSILKEDYIITNKGILKSSGFNLSEYLDKEISFWVKDNELFALADITKQNPILKNVYITDISPATVSVFSGGAERIYEKADNFIIENENSTLKIADISLNNGKIASINFTTEMKEKQIKSFTNNQITCIDDETFDTTEDYGVYYIQNNKIMLGNKSDLIEGKTYEIYLKDNKVCAFIFDKLGFVD